MQNNYELKSCLSSNSIKVGSIEEDNKKLRHATETELMLFYRINSR